MAYTYSRSLTIDHTKCGTADSTDFPVIFTGTYSWLATVGNGGRVQSSSGYDIVFAADSAGVTPLNFERVKYTGSSGLVEFWVKIPTLSHTTDTVIYVLYGDASVTTDQSSATSACDANDQAVYHFGDGSTLSLVDSTSNGYTATNTSVTAVSSSVSVGAAAFNGSANLDLGASANTNFSNTQAHTISLWMKTSSFSSEVTLAARMNNSSPFQGWSLDYGNGSQPRINYFLINTYPSNYYQANTANINSHDGSWHQWAVTDPGTGPGNVKLYLDGASQGPPGTVGALTATSATSTHTTLGARTGGGNFTGSLDEVRIATAVRSGDWILASYNNQQSPATFYSVGSEVGGTGASPLVQPCFFIVM